MSNRTSYDYDVNGNLNVVHQGTPGSFVPGGAGDGAVVKRFFWDAENQLIGFEKPAPAGSGQLDQRTTWEYDSMGRRIFEKNYSAAPGSGNWTLVETIRQWWEGTTMIQRERTFGSSPSGSIRYVLHDSGEMEHDSINATTTTRLYVTDHLGSVRVVLPRRQRLLPFVTVHHTVGGGQ